MENKKTNTEPRKRGRPKKVEAVVKKPRGRPSLYSDELADVICERVLTRPLHQVCKDDDMPHEHTIYGWIAKHPDFLEKYTRARQFRAYSRAESIDQIADDVRRGILDAQQARVLIDAIKWQSGKENPKVFGDKLELSGNKDAPLTVQVVRLSDIPPATE